MNENDITYKIRGAIFKVHNELGPGLLESVYEAALLYQLRKDGLHVESQKKLDVYYDGHLLPVDFRLDIIVEDKVIIELKSVEVLKDLYKKCGFDTFLNNIQKGIDSVDWSAIGNNCKNIFMGRVGKIIRY